jgi:hypothetical protein
MRNIQSGLERLVSLQPHHEEARESAPGFVATPLGFAPLRSGIVKDKRGPMSGLPNLTVPLLTMRIFISGRKAMLF